MGFKCYITPVIAEYLPLHYITESTWLLANGTCRSPLVSMPTYPSGHNQYGSGVDKFGAGSEKAILWQLVCCSFSLLKSVQVLEAAAGNRWVHTLSASYDKVNWLSHACPKSFVICSKDYWGLVGWMWTSVRFDHLLLGGSVRQWQDECSICIWRCVWRWSILSF